MIISLVVLSTILTFESISESKNALLKKSYDSLTSSRDSKSNQIQNFFKERVADINIISKSENIRALVDDLMYVHEVLAVKANENYPVKDFLTVERTLPHESFFQEYTKEYGYYDVFVLCAEHGHVMYTQAKESDYGANVGSGSLKDSGLGEVYKKVKELKRVVFVDMRPYAPSADEPAMFLGRPIFIDGVMKSIVVFQISDAAINKIMQFRKGYGESQEDYLVGKDKLMRSDSYLDTKGHSLRASFANPSVGKCDTQASRNALSGKSDTEIVIDYNGNPVLSAYKPIQISKDLTWALMSEIDEAEVLITSNNIRNTLVILTFVLLILIIFVTYFVQLIQLLCIESCYNFHITLI